MRPKGDLGFGIRASIGNRTEMQSFEQRTQVGPRQR